MEPGDELVAVPAVTAGADVVVVQAGAMTTHWSIRHGGKLIVLGAVSGGLIPIYIALLLTTPLWPAVSIILSITIGCLIPVVAIQALDRWG